MKVIFCIGAVALIALAAVNVSIALQSEKGAKLNLASSFSLAQNENGGGTGGNGGSSGENGGTGGNGGTGTKKQTITTTREVLETYTRHSDGARCEKYIRTTVSKCDDGGTSLCTEYTIIDEGISCTVFS
jgi:hypothetical protein